MKRAFLELPAFSRLVISRQISDSQLMSIQESIIAGRGATIRDTGGIRKIRCEEEAEAKAADGGCSSPITMNMI